MVDDVDAAGAVPEPGLDGDDVAGAEFQAAAGVAAVGDVGFFVHPPADAVTAEVEVGADACLVADRSDGRADVTQSSTRHGGRDTRRQRLLGGGDQLEVLGARSTDDEARRGVGAPAVDRGAAVDVQQIAVRQPYVARQAVQHRVVHRSTDDAAERAGREPRLVSIEQRRRPGRSQYVASDLVQLAQGHADGGFLLHRGECRGDHPSGSAHLLDLRRRLQFHHLLSPQLHVIVIPVLLSRSRPLHPFADGWVRRRKCFELKGIRALGSDHVYQLLRDGSPCPAPGRRGVPGDGIRSIVVGPNASWTLPGSNPVTSFSTSVPASVR